MAEGPILFAASPVQPWRVEDGFSLRARAILRGLCERFRVVFLGPGTPASGEELPLLAHAEIARPKSTSLPDPHLRGELVRVSAELLERHSPAAALLWPGMEFLRWSVADFPPSLADRIDSISLTAWRAPRDPERGALGWLSDLLHVAWYEHKVVRRVEWTTAVGPDDVAALRRVGLTRRVSEVPNGVDPPAGSPPARSPQPTLAFTGVLDYPPNVDAIRFLVSEVWPCVRARVPAAELILAGRTPAPAVRALDGRDGVRMLADVPSISDVLAGAWLAIAPMRTGSGIKNKVLEAWVVGTPVVMTGIAANGLHPDPELSSCVADAAGELAARVSELLLDDPSRRQLGEHWREVALRRHGWRTATDAIAARLERLAGS